MNMLITAQQEQRERPTAKSLDTILFNFTFNWLGNGGKVGLFIIPSSQIDLKWIFLHQLGNSELYSKRETTSS